MNLTFTHKNGNHRLLLIMAGWGMDANPFRELKSPGYDIAIGWDYTDEDLDTERLSAYREIVLMAWSMGVMESIRILSRTHLPITLTIAVNGTVTPVSDQAGIPVDVFNGTLATLSADNLKRFNRRMCGSRENLASFESTAPARTIDSLRAELEALGTRAIHEQTVPFPWDMAVIGTRDMIFPPSAQRQAWSHNRVIEVDAPHYFDFQEIINTLIVNKERVASCFHNARDSYDSQADIQTRVASHLSQLLLDSTTRRDFDKAIEIGTGGGQLTHLLDEHLDIKQFELWDIAPVSETGINGAIHVTDDAEARLFEITGYSIDLIASASTLQWFNSPRVALENIARSLSPGGITAIAMYIDGTFRSLNRHTGSTLNYMTRETVISALPPGCHILVNQCHEFTQKFDNTRSMLEHISKTGVNGTRSVSPGTLRRLLSDNELCTLEYNCMFLIIEKQS